MLAATLTHNAHALIDVRQVRLMRAIMELGWGLGAKTGAPDTDEVLALCLAQITCNFVTLFACHNAPQRALKPLIRAPR